MLNRNGFMSVEDQIKVITEDDIKQMSDDELVMWRNTVWTRCHHEHDTPKRARLCEINKWIDDELEKRDIHCTFCDLLYKQLAANPSLIRYSKSPESEFFDTTSVTFDNCGRMFMSGNDWTENNLQMRFCPKCGRYMSKLEKLCWENLPKMKATKKSIEHKYRETQQVDIEDVRAMVNDYENKIKRLKFLLNDTKRKFDKRHTELWQNATYSQSYVNHFVRIFRERPDALTKEALDNLEKYLEDHKIYW